MADLTALYHTTENIFKNEHLNRIHFLERRLYNTKTLTAKCLEKNKVSNKLAQNASGVYFWTNSDDELLYIGKSWCLAQRIGAHHLSFEKLVIDYTNETVNFHPHYKGRASISIFKYMWSKNVFEFEFTIRFVLFEDVKHLYSTVEEFEKCLISFYKPRLNTQSVNFLGKKI